ncbi:MAG: LemA [Faecalibacterium sp.]|jgi:hypothetical protein|nr:LemA [Faecalibacterium sp.]
MANADFNQQNTPQGGFSAESYRAAAEKPARSLTPTQQKLAAAEKKLPAALQSKAAATAIAVVMIVLSVFGFGGAKLRGRYTEVENAVTIGVAADTRYSSEYTVAAQLSARASNAQSLITAAGDLLGTDNSYVAAAQAALSALNEARDGTSVKAMHDTDAALEAAADALYAEAQSVSGNATKMGTLQTSYTNYNSAGRVLGNLSYNELAQTYNDEAGFPANLIGSLWGCGKAELFA